MAGCLLVKETDLGRSELERFLDKGDVAKELGVEFVGLKPEHVADKVTITEPPTDEQLEVLRGLHTRTSATRGEAS